MNNAQNSASWALNRGTPKRSPTADGPDVAYGTLRLLRVSEANLFLLAPGILGSERVEYYKVSVVGIVCVRPTFPVQS